MGIKERGTDIKTEEEEGEITEERESILYQEEAREIKPTNANQKGKR